MLLSDIMPAGITETEHCLEDHSDEPQNHLWETPMKKNFFITLLLISLTTILCAGDYFIGSGTSTEYYVPFYGYNDYGWSKFCFSQAELASAGLTNGATITKIGFYVDNAISGYVTNNQIAYMGAFYNDYYGSVDTSYPNTGSYTQIYNGSITWEGSGWMVLTLSNPYTWNSSWGLEILWENHDGTKLSPYPKFRTSSVSNTSVHKYQNSSYPASTGGTRSNKRPNIWLITPATDVPPPAVAIAPVNSATDVEINSNLRWNHAGGDPTGYRLWLGTNNPPSNLVSNLVLTQQNYTPTSYLEYGTTYYWRVVPYNDFGGAIDCPVWSFTTKADPTIYSFPYTQDFEGAFNPTGWTDHAGGLVDPIVLGTDGSSLWEQDDWLNIAATEKAARINIFGTVTGYFISPIFNIANDNYVVEFDLALLKYNQPPTGTPPALTGVDDRFAVLVSDGFSWSTANIIREWNNSGSADVYNNISVNGTHVTISLAGLTGRKRIALFAGSTISNADNDLMVNNFTVKEMLQTPVINITQDQVLNQINLSWTAVPNAVIYRIYRSETPNGTFELIGTSDGTGFQTTPTTSKAFFKVIASSVR